MRPELLGDRQRAAHPGCLVPWDVESLDVLASAHAFARAQVITPDESSAPTSLSMIGAMVFCSEICSDRFDANPTRFVHHTEEGS